MFALIWGLLQRWLDGSCRHPSPCIHGSTARQPGGLPVQLRQSPAPYVAGSIRVRIVSVAAGHAVKHRLRADACGVSRTIWDKYRRKHGTCKEKTPSGLRFRPCRRHEPSSYLCPLICVAGRSPRNAANRTPCGGSASPTNKACFEHRRNVPFLPLSCPIWQTVHDHSHLDARHGGQSFLQTRCHLRMPEERCKKLCRL